MELSPEDNFRLNVLLANQLQAIRINESTMAVYGLSAKGEVKVQLHPTCRDEWYLRQVRELISGHILNSPGGYPTYLQRWTRMGQARDDNLEQLLMLGEPAAVVAVVNAPGLTPELARRAWWAMPNAENARSMLTCKYIVQSDLGRVLAAYLIEHLPFEEEPVLLIESIRLILQENLVDEATRQHLWHKGRTKNTYLVGFLWTMPDSLPNSLSARADAVHLQNALEPLLVTENPIAKQIMRVTSSTGQTFIETCIKILRKPSNQDVVNALFDIIAHYFSDVCPIERDQDRDIEALMAWATGLCNLQNSPIELREVITRVPALQSTVCAMLILGHLNYSVLRPIFSRTTAMGSLMRKKLLPVTTPLLTQLTILRETVS